MEDLRPRRAYLGHFAESSPLLSKVDDNAASPILGFLDSLFNSEYEVRTTGANIRAKNIASVALDICQLQGNCRGVISDETYLVVDA